MDSRISILALTLLCSVEPKLAAACDAEKPAAETKKGESGQAAIKAGEAGAIRQRFVPQKKAPGAGNGASGTTLHRGMLEITQLTAMAHLGLDDVFPVRDEHGQKLFDIRLTDGNDQHLVLEIRDQNVAQKIAVASDEATEVTVGGVKYEIYYPTTEVGPNDPATTSQAMLIITQRR